MSSSLRDQLLAAGLATKKQAKQADHSRRQEKKARQQSNKSTSARVLTPADLAREAAERKAEKDRKLNEKREAQRIKKEVQAQVRQLVESNRVDRKDGELTYRFKLGNRIEKIYVTEKIQKGLASGELGIVRLANLFEVVPAEAAIKIAQRDASALIQLLDTQSGQTADPEDPYADFQVPDDLIW